jgi:hypothetical protein
VPASGKVIDVCGVCGGNGLTCVDITTNVSSIVNCTSQVIFTMTHLPANNPIVWSIFAGPSVGSAYINPSSGVTIWQNPAHVGEVWFVVKGTSLLNSSIFAIKNLTFTVLNCSDCSGNQLGTQLLDVCGICGGNGKSCLDCFGVPYGSGFLDACNVCNGTNTTCDMNKMPTWVIYLIIILGMAASIFLFWNLLKALLGETIYYGDIPPEKPNIPKQRFYVNDQPEILPPMNPTETMVRRMNPHNKAVDLFPNSITIPVAGTPTVSVTQSIGEPIQQNQSRFHDIYNRFVTSK